MNDKLDVEECCHALLQGTIPVYTCKDWGGGEHGIAYIQDES
jgi:hypothetical protein